VDSLDAAALTAPLRVELGRVDGWLATLRPGSVLAPLQSSYDSAAALVHRLDPDVWGAPLAGLHAELVALADRLDLGPLFTELADRRRALVELARDGLVQAITAADLPEPLAGWFARVLPLVTGVTDVLTLDPGGAVRELRGRVRADLTPSALYAPLEEVFAAALGVLATVPPADLVAAATGLRDAVTALDELEPQALVIRLRAAHTRLIGLHPPVLAPLADVVRLRAAFHARVDVAVTTPAGQVARVDARFDAAIALLDGGVAGSVAHRLDQAQDAALTALRRAGDTLVTDPGLAAAQESYGRLRAAVDALVPPGLPRIGPLTADVVLAACEHWRPSVRAGDLDGRLAAFVAALEPGASALDAAFDGFLADLDAIAALIDPLALEPPIAEIFDAVRAQVDALDPGTLLADLRTEVYLPITQAVAALDPHELAVRLDAAYTAARTAVLAELTGLVDDVTDALKTHLATVRAAVDTLLGRLDATVTGVTKDVQDVLKRVSDLVFVGLVQRLRQVLDNLQHSFDTELRRIARAFDAMLDAAPIGHRTHAGRAPTPAGST
jgi:hypothetical protein